MGTNDYNMSSLYFNSHNMHIYFIKHFYRIIIRITFKINVGKLIILFCVECSIFNMIYFNIYNQK